MTRVRIGLAVTIEGEVSPDEATDQALQFAKESMGSITALIASSIPLPGPAKIQITAERIE